MRKKAGAAVVLAGIVGVSCSLCVLHSGNPSGKVWIDAEEGQEQFSVSSLETSEIERKNMLSPQTYANIAISQVSGHVNIRQEPNTSSSVVGKIYHNCAAEILETVEGEGGKWYRIQSGTVNGYIKAQYFLTGARAEAAAKQAGTVYAKVNTSSLRLRAEPNLTSETLTMLAQGAEYVVLEEKNNFAKLSVDEDLTGYVSMDYIETRVEFQQAVSVQEEAAKLTEENRRRLEAQEALRKLEDAKLVEAKPDSLENSLNSTFSPAENGIQYAVVVGSSEPSSTIAATDSIQLAMVVGSLETNHAAAAADSFETIAANPFGEGASPQVLAPEINTTQAMPSLAEVISINPDETRETTVWMGGNTSSALVTATRNAIVAYAKQFLGNRYVYGGSSLTNGTDCSGFVMRIYEHFGISTGRSSRNQAANGRQIAIEAVQPGDLLFYASGNTINHVAIYIGGGQVIHAASARTGIVISPSNYRTPCKAATFLD